MSRIKSPPPSFQTVVNDANNSQAAAGSSADIFSQPATEEADRATSLIGMNELHRQTLAANVPTQRYGRMYASLDHKGVVAPGLGAGPDAHLVAKGVTVLETLLGLTSDLNESFVLWSSTWDEQTSLGPIEKAAWQATHAMLSDLRHADSPVELRERSRILTERSAYRVSYPRSAEDRALCRAFVGESLRWELLGMYCSRIGLYFGYQESATPSSGAGGNANREPKSMLRQAFFACTECASLCASLGQVNDLTIFHLCTAISLATWCFGDDSYHAWQLIGDVSSVVYSLKFNKPSVIGEGVPLYLSELRKRALGQIHEHDKLTATFVGRPPRLTRRYCTMQMPFDLANEVIEGSTECLEMAVAMLGEDGWDKSRLIMPATRQRVLMILCPLREEVLELSLGSSVADWVPRAQ
ncbi:hypothetical protein LTR78_004759 [Recurvomyces mirabilis]|uniref:Uncharacterized protein n=1 Tax=Recurvomyces mirabilis TaxID=574656 RepID=A0AAE0WNX1_9PEZI|nr:hypothetical protein LTR78_004759 [Recurvomyces mirabilis]KAK5157930.1 hypothetical protein LTS14_003853 [Recurvomyces mirabilis]